MIGLFFFFARPDKIKKVKDWKRNKDIAFEIITRNGHGAIQVVKRISDNQLFEVINFYKFPVGENAVRYFCEDLIHVSVRTFWKDMSGIDSPENRTIHINDLDRC